MADLSQTIQIIFDGVDNVGGVVDGIGKDLSNLSGAAQDVTGPLSDITESLLLFEAAAVAAGAGMAALAVTAAGEFNQSFAEIATLTGASSESLGQFRDDLLDYASTSSSAFASITDATYAAVSAGIDYGDSVEFVSQAERLAIASKADLSDTTVLLASTLNAFGASADEAAHYSDVLFTTVRLGQTTLPELASSLAQVSSTAAAAGVPIESIAAAVADLTAKGLPTSQAITGIKAALSNIIKPSQDAAAAADELGVAFGVQALQSEGLDGLLRSLAEATGGNVEEMARFFGSVEGLNAVMALSADGAATFSANLLEMRDSTGAVDAAYGLMADNFELVNQRIQNSVNALLVEAGDPLESRWSEIGDSLSAVFLAIRDSVDEGAFTDVYEAIDAFVLDLIGSMDQLAANLPAALEGLDFSGLLDATSGVAKAISDLFSGIDLTTPEGLHEAIQGVIDVISGLTDVTAGVVAGFGPFVDALADSVKWFTDLTPQAREASGEVLGLATGFDKILSLADTAGSMLQGVGSALNVIAASQAATAITRVSTALGAEGLSAAASKAGSALALVASAWAGWEAGNWLAEVTGLDAAMTDLAESVLDAGETIGPAGEKLGVLPETLQEISARTGVAVDSMAAFNRAVDDGTLVFDEASNQWVKAGTALRDFDAEVAAAAGSSDSLLLTTDELAAAMGPVAALLGDAATSTGALAAGTGEAAVQTGELVRVIKDAEGNIIGYEQAGRSATAALEAQKAATKNVAEESEAYRIKLLEIASDERIALIESHFQLNIAELEAQTAQVQAAFDSIDGTIKSTGELISDLFGDLLTADSWWERDLIIDQLEAEQKAREEAFKLQEKLIEAEIRQIDARTKLIESGGGEVKITTDGLEPALEAFMFAVIDKVRVAVSTSYEDFLLGCSP